MGNLMFPKPTVTRDRIAYKRERERNLDAAKRAVWQRDQGHCRICQRYVTRTGTAETRGDIAHIVARSKSKALRAVTSNLLLVCRPCHADMHTYAVTVSGNANGTLTIKRVG